MKDDRKDERPDSTEDEAPERDLRYGDAFGTQRDRSKSEEGGYLDPEFGSREHSRPGESEPPEEREKDTPTEGSESLDKKAGERSLRYGDAFGTQRDRSKPEEDGYLDPEFGSREHSRPGESEPPEEREKDTED